MLILVSKFSGQISCDTLRYLVCWPINRLTNHLLRQSIINYNDNTTEWSPIQSVIVSFTNFSIVIGCPRAHLSRNRRVITWVSNYGCPIWTFCNWIPEIGYPLDFYVNYARFIGFLRNVFYSFQNFNTESPILTFCAQKKFSKDIFNPKCVIDTIN